MTVTIADLRKDYRQQQLLERDVHPDPLQQFQRWFDQAVQAQLPEPNAMTLATVNAAGQPSARIVLLKGLDAGGFTFFTNYTGRKGRELAENPQAALVFWWEALERQVRVEGRVEQVTAAESDQYFHSRPVTSQLGAWASDQSAVIANRQALEDRFQQLQQQYQDQPIPRPAHWGGYRLIPELIEFWQGRPSRLHDRLCYTRQEGQQRDGWQLQRLAP